MDNKFSLIMATYGRFQEVDNFLKSIINVYYNKELIEVIIVDQNDRIDIRPIIDKYKDFVSIIHIKSTQKGLSLNRNIGLEYAGGNIVAFPDDDCEYLDDTLTSIDGIFTNHNDIEVLMGRIIERDGTDSIRTWPKESININRGNFYTKCSSVTMFFRMNNKVYFDEKLGVGTSFGSCEDTDILYRHLQGGSRVLYNPNIKIYHPHPKESINSGTTLQKVYSYGLGFGAFCKKNLDSYIFILFLKAEVYHLMNVVIGIVLFRRDKYTKGLVAFKSRIKGVFIFKKDNRK